MDYNKKDDTSNLLKELLGDIQQKTKKRRTTEEIELNKQSYLTRELKYDHEINNEQYNLNYLWSKAYTLYYNIDGIRNWYPHKFLDFINQLKDNNKIEDFWNLIDALKNGPEQAACYLEKYRLYEYLQNYSQDLNEIIKNIKNQDEASLVMDAIISCEENMLNLPKGYKLTKKNQTKRNRRAIRKTIYTYEHALRLNRHLLENYLKEIGVGQQRAQKISQILLYL